MPVTLNGAGAGVVTGGGVSAFFWHPATSEPASARIARPATTVRRMRVPSLGIWTGPAALGLRDLEDLSGVDEIGILDLVPVGLPDPAPLIGVAVVVLRDLREIVARHDGVGRLLRG